MPTLADPLTFSRGPAMKNRFMLAPLTNTQSHDDGVLSDEEFRWLTMRAEGGFALTMTCAAHVQEVGRGFPGQLGVWSDRHLAGLTRLAEEIRGHDSVSIVQLHHAGNRAPETLNKMQPVCPSDDAETGARGLSETEVRVLVDDFIAAAVRAEKAGFDGVELHGAHGYILCQFFSEETNRREDQYGGSVENRYRILDEIIDGVRNACRPDFMLGVRLSPERFGLKLAEVRDQAERLMTGGQLDFLDMSLWSCFKDPVEEAFAGTPLIRWFTDLERGQTRLGVAGNIRTPADAQRVLEEGVDWVMLGRAAVLHHDFPRRCIEEPEFQPASLPVTRAYLNDQGLSDRFVKYMNQWKGFVSDPPA